jgi:hypothetical protein
MLLRVDRAYLEKIATSAQDEALHKAACAMLS